MEVIEPPVVVKPNLQGTQDPKLSLRRLAEREGEVAPTLVRHFKLLKLSPEIQSYLVRLRDPKAIHFFSQRRLAPLADMSDADQRKTFRQWQVEFSALATIASNGPPVAVRPTQRRANGVRLF